MQDQFHITQVRRNYYSRTTIGDVSLEGEHFCYTLEDTVRAYGIKLKKETAIPASPQEGFKVGIRYSPSAGRDRLIIYTEDDQETLAYGGISFKYIYAHGGNKHEHTEGCVLVAFNKDGNKISGSAESALFMKIAPMIRAGIDVRWHVINLKQVS